VCCLTKPTRIGSSDHNKSNISHWFTESIMCLLHRRPFFTCLFRTISSSVPCTSRSSHRKLTASHWQKPLIYVFRAPHHSLHSNICVSETSRDASGARALNSLLLFHFPFWATAQRHCVTSSTDIITDAIATSALFSGRMMPPIGPRFQHLTKRYYLAFAAFLLMVNLSHPGLTIAIFLVSKNNSIM